MIAAPSRLLPATGYFSFETPPATGYPFVRNQQGRAYSERVRKPAGCGAYFEWMALQDLHTDSLHTRNLQCLV